MRAKRKIAWDNLEEFEAKYAKRRAALQTAVRQADEALDVIIDNQVRRERKSEGIQVSMDDLMAFGQENKFDSGVPTRLWGVLISNQLAALMHKRDPVAVLECNGSYRVNLNYVLRAAPHMSPGHLTNYGPKSHELMTLWVESLRDQTA